MKLSLSELERARKEPKKFAARKLRKFGGLRPTFPMYWVLAAKVYHRLKKNNHASPQDEAISYFEQHCQNKLSGGGGFDPKLLAFANKLHAYIASYESMNYPLIQVNKRVELSDVGNHVLSGRVDRLDMNPVGGYLGTNFEATESEWKRNLRVAITQQALANELGCPPSEIQIGMYCIETGRHTYVSLAHMEIKHAISEAEKVLNAVQAEMQRLKKVQP